MRSVTDGRTDRQTDRRTEDDIIVPKADRIYCVAVTVRSAKMTAVMCAVATL